MKFASSLFALSTAALAVQAAQQQQKQQSVCSQDIIGTGQGDLDAIKGCKQYQGTITVSNVSGSDLVLDGVETVTGSVIITDSSGLSRFSAPNLKSVSGELKITQHLGLVKLELPALSEVQRLTLRVLPEVEAIDFPAGLAKVNQVTIDDTPVATVNGLTFDTVGKLTLSQNTLMKRFELPASRVSESLLVVGNSHELDFEAPQLLELQAAEFREVGTVNMPSVAHVEGDLSFHNSDMTSLNLDNLERVGGTMVIANNNHIANMSFKKLELVGGALSIANNTQLSTIKGYPSLSAVHGTVDLAGGFDKYEFPALQDVRGGMRIQTTNENFSCMDAEKTMKYGSVVKGTVWGCKSNMEEENMDPAVGQNDGSSTSSDDNGSTLLPKKQNAGNHEEDVAENPSSAQSAAALTTTSSIHYPSAMVFIVALLYGSLF